MQATSSAPRPVVLRVAFIALCSSAVACAAPLELTADNFDDHLGGAERVANRHTFVEFCAQDSAPKPNQRAARHALRTFTPAPRCACACMYGRCAMVRGLQVVSTPPRSGHR